MIIIIPPGLDQDTKALIIAIRDNYEQELRRSDRRVLWLLFVIAAMIVAMTVFSFVFHVPCR